MCTQNIYAKNIRKPVQIRNTAKSKFMSNLASDRSLEYVIMNFYHRIYFHSSKPAHDSGVFQSINCSLFS